MNRILLTFLVSLFFSVTMNAQDTLLVVTSEVFSKITYDPTGSPASETNNIIIRGIAEEAVKNLKNVQVVIRASVKSYLLISHGVTYIKIKPDTFNISGDHFYRKFSVSDVMIPSVFSLTLQCRSAQDSLIIAEYRDLAVSSFVSDSIVVPIMGGGTAESRVLLIIDNARFFFTEAGRLKLRERQKLIDDYYAAAAIADSLEPVMRSMDLRKTDWLPLYFIQLEEISRIEQLLGSRNFEERLSLPLFDPRNLDRKYSDLMRFTRSMVMTFGSILDTIPAVTPAIGADSLITDFLSVIQRYMRWSFLINERNSSIYREFLDRFYSMNAFADDDGMLLKLVRKIYPATNADSIFRDLLFRLKNEYQRQAESFSEDSRYAEAVDLLDHLAGLEKRFTFLQDTLHELAARSKAAWGIYSSYIEVAENSLRMDKIAIARWFLDKAAGYARSNPLLITNDSLYRRALLAYHVSSLEECDAIYRKDDFPGAVECYHDFRKSLDSLSSAVLSSELGKRIALARRGIFLELVVDARRMIRADKQDSAIFLFDQAVIQRQRITEITIDAGPLDSLRPVIEKFRYGQLVAEAERYDARRQFADARSSLIGAVNISRDQQYPFDAVLDSLERRIYPGYVEELFARARPLIWTNQFQKAELFADSVEKTIEKDGFSGNPAMASTLAGYRKRIRERICQEASESINILLIRAQRSTTGRNYIVAASLFDSALLVARMNPVCRLDTNKTVDSIKKFLPARQFQEMMIRLDGFVSLGEYEGFAQKYAGAGNFYSANSLKRFGLEYPSLAEYVKNRSREQLTLSISGYYVAGGNPLEAFRYLEIMKEQGYPSKDAAEIMKSAGLGLASADFKSDPAGDPLIITEKYTGNDPWYAIFTDAYRKEWKRLKSTSRG